jgi:transposase
MSCGVLRQVKVDFADERRSYTKGFERYVLELSKHMTTKEVAAHLGVSWDVIKNIRKCNLNRRFARPKLGKLKRIAIDEICIGKGHEYLTIVLDLESGAVGKNLPIERLYRRFVNDIIRFVKWMVPISVLTYE